MDEDLNPCCICSDWSTIWILEKNYGIGIAGNIYVVATEILVTIWNFCSNNKAISFFYKLFCVTVFTSTQVNHHLKIKYTKRYFNNETKTNLKLESSMQCKMTMIPNIMLLWFWKTLLLFVW